MTMCSPVMPWEQMDDGNEEGRDGWEKETLQTRVCERVGTHWLLQPLVQSLSSGRRDPHLHSALPL